MFANSATSPAHRLGASRYTCSYTREGNPLLAHNAATQYSCTQADDLKKRLLAHSGEKPFVHTTFWLLTVYNTSKPQDAQCTSIRSGERHFRCEQCNYSSNRAGHLKNHKPTHTGGKFFACKQCNYTCSHSNSLMRHMLSHTGEKPFACKQCNYSCKQSKELKKHMRKHTTKGMA